ncbi:MAG: substrate-binding domain-containing protein [Planctomycetes bacterium]|nr:substrate-binding domain-containing protein [Planctomycetota bacterium]
MKHRLLLLLLALLTIPLACTKSEPATGGPAASQEPERLRLATTTSTRDSGLLDLLLPVFEHETGCAVDVIAVGTGAALQLGRNGDVDVVLVHARKAEEAFMAEGHARRHEEFMVNYFLILGPRDDPAAVRGCEAEEAMKRMAAAGATFVSRGDDSGTHKKEKAIRAAAGLAEGWPQLIESGQGMGATLLMADEKNAYVLADEATWISRRAEMRLEPLVEKKAGLRNPYAVMPLDPEKHPGSRSALAEKLADFLISTRCQELIRDYEIGGARLFTPTRL